MSYDLDAQQSAKARAFDLARNGDMAGLRSWTAEMGATGRDREATEILEEIQDAGLESVAEHLRGVR